MPHIACIPPAQTTHCPMPFTTMNLPTRQPSILPHTLLFFCPSSLPMHFMVHRCKASTPKWDPILSHAYNTPTPHCCALCQHSSPVASVSHMSQLPRSTAAAEAAASSGSNYRVWVIAQASSGGQARMRICTRGKSCFHYQHWKQKWLRYLSLPLL